MSVPSAAEPDDAPGRTGEHEGVRHHVALEVGGPAVLGSLVYELQPLEGLGLRGGLAVVPLCFNGCSVVPITTGGVSYWTPGERHHLEVGVTFTYVWMDDDDARFVVPTVGYRYQPRDGNLVVRVEATPLFRLNDIGDVLPWAGASVGWRF